MILCVVVALVIYGWLWVTNEDHRNRDRFEARIRNAHIDEGVK